MYRCYYPHTSRESVSPVCRIFLCWIPYICICNYLFCVFFILFYNPFFCIYVCVYLFIYLCHLFISIFLLFQERRPLMSVSPATPVEDTLELPMSIMTTETTIKFTFAKSQFKSPVCRRPMVPAILLQ